jgi:hypothetical protein
MIFRQRLFFRRWGDDDERSECTCSVLLLMDGEVSVSIIVVTLKQLTAFAASVLVEFTSSFDKCSIGSFLHIL